MMQFFLSNFNNATKSLAKGSFFTGMLLIGFGTLVFVLRDLFAMLAATVFFIAGFSAIWYSTKLFLASRKNRDMNSTENAYRKNVTIHHEES
jgi:hypothetical protein